MKYRAILLLGLLWTVLTACIPRVQAVQPTQTGTVVLDAQHTVGQTFVARYDGLSAILVYLSPGESGEGELVFHLHADAGAEDDLAQAAMPLSRVTQAGQYRFDFTPLRDSSQQYYYAVWEVTGTGSLGVASSTCETYQHGALYQQGTPQDGQLVFSLEYDPAPMGLGLVPLFYPKRIKRGWWQPSPHGTWMTATRPVQAAFFSLFRRPAAAR